MEELHRIHKDVPFGYWVEWAPPAFRALARTWRALTATRGRLLTLR
ncbi:MAG: hypothetical protein JNK30_06510 [Phenylobacterium sp.]|nr:hypothetical protein [Phenylobacterium sp.]MBL8771019.1 hypothetical protein [Phenylobacterium sp.]